MCLLVFVEANKAKSNAFHFEKELKAPLYKKQPAVKLSYMKTVNINN